MSGLCYGVGVGVLCGSLWVAEPASALEALHADFDLGTDGFLYQDDLFRGTATPGYASGTWLATGGFDGGALRVDLGGLDGASVNGMSGGFRASFSLASNGSFDLEFRYNLSQSAEYEILELSQIMVELDGVQHGTGGADFVAEVKGDGNGGPTRSTGWRLFRVSLGALAVGPHFLTIGGYNNQKTAIDEFTEIWIDEVRVVTSLPAIRNLAVEAIVAELDSSKFFQNVEHLASYGTRHYSQPENPIALDWIEAELASYGYTVERHGYTYNLVDRESVSATKVGTLHPDRMYIVSAHMDSIHFADVTNAPGADDDASGTSLVLETARVFSPPWVETETSIRFILWNNEETGLHGSQSYVSNRRALQGIENPPGSGLYPEPTWLGIIQHDMILYDHGLPPSAQQSAAADIDIEYQSGADVIGDAIELATRIFDGNVAYASDYPAEVSADMNWTDSKAFQDDCAAVSLRENRRVAELGGGANPHWHKPTDVVANYSAADFLLGFNTLQTTVGAVAELAGAVVLICGDGIVPQQEACDDHDTESGDGCDASCQVEQDWTCVGEPSTCAVCRIDNLRFADRETLVWGFPGPGVCASLFDVATGDLEALHGTGDFSAAVCLENDRTAAWLQETSAPSPGVTFWYLVRVDGDSWNGSGGRSAADRDATLLVCP